jgi:molybdopterin-guanine dinucleotide biosynthesis protein A
MGGIDKGLQELNGRPLVQWVLERLAPQVGTVLINANQNLARYGEFGYPVLPDVIAILPARWRDCTRPCRTRARRCW